MREQSIGRYWTQPQFLTFELTGIVQEFRYDVRRGRYVYSNGRVVPFSVIRTALDAVLDASEAEMISASRALQSGKISISDWQQRIGQSIKDSHLASAALSKGGWSQMGAADFGRVGGRVLKQYKFLQKFAQQIESGLFLDGRFLNRVKLYAQAGRVSYHAGLRAEMALKGKDSERSVLAPADHCSECVSEAKKGWGPIGHIKLIGNRICKSNCRCLVEYK